MNSEWLCICFFSSFYVIAYVCIYKVSICDFVSNVNFSVGAPEWTPDKQKTSERGLAGGGAGLGL